MLPIIYAGIDPAASPNKPTGCVALDRNARLIAFEHCRTDEEILDFFQPYALKAVAIDAPKGLPLGMGLCCLEDAPKCDCPPTPSRQCERLMRQRGIALYPVTKRAFAKSWIRRGLLLFLRFQGMGIPSFEVYPTGSKRRLFPAVAFPKPKGGREARCILQESLMHLIADIPRGDEILLSDHLLDAILAAYTLYIHFETKRCESVGDGREGEILLPLPV